MLRYDNFRNVLTRNSEGGEYRHKRAGNNK